MRKLSLNRKKEGGFSLVEMAIVLVIIGLIVSAIAVGRTTMRKGEALKLWQQHMNPWIQSALNTWANTGTDGFGSVTGLAGTFEYGGGTVTNTSAKAADGVMVITFTSSGTINDEACTELEGVMKNTLATARSFSFACAGIMAITYDVPSFNQSNASTS